MGVKTVKIDNKVIGINQPVFIIAEAGVNHNGNKDLALQLVRKAKECGADCVKFQTFKADQVVTETSPKATYQLKTTDPEESQLEMLKKLELQHSAYIEIFQLCKDLGILFLSTPYSIDDIDFLDNLGVSAYKVASGQIIEHHFLDYIAQKKKPIFLSTGMSNISEIDQALRCIRNTGNNDIVLLQCTTNYPSNIEDTNLRAMQTMKETFDILVGYSDHTQSLVPGIMTAGLGGCVVERHFTLDKSLPGPDQNNSSDPAEFAQFVKLIREAELCLGDSIKAPSKAELLNAKGMRRSIVAKTKIQKGQKITYDNTTLKRPANGILGNFHHMLINRKASNIILENEIIDIGMLE